MRHRYNGGVEDLAERAAARRAAWTGGCAASFREMARCDREFWEAATPSQRLDATWEMALFFRSRGRDMEQHHDFRDLLAVFARAGVRYLLVEGYAVAFHGAPRFTKDIDLWLDPEPRNIERAVAALAEFGAPASIQATLRTSRPDEIVYLGRPPVRIDLFKTLPGVAFAPCHERRVDGAWGGVAVSVIGIADLVEAKRASGRPQDLIDIESLDGSRGENP